MVASVWPRTIFVSWAPTHVFTAVGAQPKAGLAFYDFDRQIRKVPGIDVYSLDLDAVLVRQVQQDFLDGTLRPANNASIAFIKVYPHVRLPFPSPQQPATAPPRMSTKITLDWYRSGAYYSAMEDDPNEAATVRLPRSFWQDVTAFQKQERIATRAEALRRLLQYALEKLLKGRRK